MNPSQPLIARFNILIIFSIVCLTTSACPEKIALKPDISMETAKALSKSNENGNATAHDLSKLAEAGNADAQNRLGLLYYDDQSVPGNYERAKQWFRKAAEQGHAGAQVNLGTLYFLGDGFNQSDHEALYWFQQAAEQENALAFAKLGRMYEKGRGVPQDFIKAHMWYNLSAARGEKRAAEIRDTLAQQMTPAQIAEAQRLAREWKPKKSKMAETLR